MSVADRPLHATKVDNSHSAQQRTIDEHNDMDDDNEVLAPGADVPALPQKSTLRGSRILDNHGLRLGGAVEELAQGASTPHDVYLSSEEDASSDADDYSDYDYDSSVEDPDSPTRISHEVTARVVSVVFAGKPSIVNLSLSKKRSISGSSSSTRTSTESIAKSVTSPSPKSSTEERPVTPAGSIALSTNPKRASLLSDILSKKKPLFLSIDPYANGSSYTLDIPKALDSLESESPVKTPRTPTQILKGVTRSFSLSRKRSRPALAVPKVDTSVTAPRPSTSSTVSKRSSLQRSVNVDNEAQQEKEKEKEEDKDMAKTPQTPITYNDILRAVKKNSMMMPPPSDVLSPTSPSTEKTSKRGILSGLAAKRRSVKLVGRQWP